MSSYAAGKYALGICDRSGFTYKLRDLVYEVQDGRNTGIRVGRDMLDPDHPQNFMAGILSTIRKRCSVQGQITG